jgi:uncharacterized protein (TIGR00730 family)
MESSYDQSTIEPIPRAVCVYCASSMQSAPAYRELAFELGQALARDGRTVIYGGSRQGSMGALADGALSQNGTVIGVLPGFLQALEIAHDRLTELHIVDDLRHRKAWLLSRASAVIALPGGTGTLEELLEALTYKRLGLFNGVIIILNQDHFYDPLLRMLEVATAERFIAPASPSLWTVAESVADALPLLDR